MAPKAWSTPFHNNRNEGTFGMDDAHGAFPRNYNAGRVNYDFGGNDNFPYRRERDRQSSPAGFSVYRDTVGRERERYGGDVDRHHELYQRIEFLENELHALRSVLKGWKGPNFGEWSRPQQIDIALPGFRGDLSEDPIEYLQELEQYIIFRRVPSEYQSKMIQNSLKGNARIWFDAVRHDLNDFSHFREVFRQEFLSIDTQERKRDRWRSRRYNAADSNLVNYYYGQLSEAVHLQPPMSIDEKNRIIVNQMPREVQIALAGVRLSDQRALVHVLTRIDESGAADNRGQRWGSGATTGFHRDRGTGTGVEQRGEVTRRNGYENGEGGSSSGGQGRPSGYRSSNSYSNREFVRPERRSGNNTTTDNRSGSSYATAENGNSNSFRRQNNTQQRVMTLDVREVDDESRPLHSYDSGERVNGDNTGGRGETVEQLPVIHEDDEGEQGERDQPENCYPTRTR